MSTVHCTRCGREAASLDKPPFSDALGEEVHANACADCWKEWLDVQVKIINEYGLLPVNPEHGEVLEKNLKVFLKLPSAADVDPGDVMTPP